MSPPPPGSDRLWAVTEKSARVEGEKIERRGNNLGSVTAREQKCLAPRGAWDCLMLMTSSPNMKSHLRCWFLFFFFLRWVLNRASKSVWLSPIYRRAATRRFNARPCCTSAATSVLRFPSFTQKERACAGGRGSAVARRSGTSRKRSPLL